MQILLSFQVFMLACNLPSLSILLKVPYLVGAYGRSRSASPGSSTRKYSPKRWFSRKSLEPVQIKVYEVDDMEKVKKAMEPSFQVQIEVFVFSVFRYSAVS